MQTEPFRENEEVVIAPLKGSRYSFTPLGIRVGQDGKSEAMCVERNDGVVDEVTMFEFALLHHYGLVSDF